MIRAESLTKFYGSRCAVRNLTVSIADREIVGFLGLNGAGKTTTLRMLAGLLAPSAGRVEIDGQDMLEAGDAIRWRIGFLPERPPLYEDMTVAAFLDFAARLRGTDPDRVKRRVEEVLETTALVEYKDEPISSLSHGFRQRVGIAQAVVHDPALVILDEPISGLDPVQIVEMRGLIRALRARHTVLLSSHILPEISQTCDRLMIIRDGELVAMGTEAELSGMLGAQQRLAVTMSGEEGLVGTVFSNLRAQGIVARWSRRVDGRSSSGIHQVDVELAKDEPETIARSVVAAGLGLRRLEPLATELEGLFLRLTAQSKPS